jgi:hypothetical protein
LATFDDTIDNAAWFVFKPAMMVERAELKLMMVPRLNLRHTVTIDVTAARSGDPGPWFAPW